MNLCLKSALLVPAIALVLAAPLFAQLQIGNGLNLSANGNIAASYSADYGNLTSSDHSLGLGGTGTISGYYFNPNFLSFSATPYYNSARDSSAFRSISNGSGIDTQASIFGGSPFPGTVSYAKAYNSQGTFNLPGLANFTTHGNSDSLGLGWGEHLPGYPSLSVSFQRSASHNSIYGLTQESDSTSHNLNINSSYQWHGFGLGGSYFRGSATSQVPEVLAGSIESLSTETSDHGYSFNLSHRLPWNGSFFSNFNSTSVQSAFETVNTNFTVDTLAAGTSFHPTSKLSFSSSMDYSSNLSGSIEQQVLTSGGLILTPSSEFSSTSHSFDFLGAIGYLPMPHMQVQGTAERRMQEFLGKTFGSNTYAGQSSYYRHLWGGNIGLGFSVEDSTLDNSPLNTLGFSSTINYGRSIGQWGFNGSANYSQGMQTLLVTYSTSSYGFSGSLRRKWHNGVVWTGSYGGARTGLTGLTGNTSKSDSLSTGLGMGHWVSIGASYSKSSGDAVITGTGLAPAPLPLPILPASSIIMFGGRSYSYSVGSSPFRRLNVSASYGRSDANTGMGVGLIGSTNTSKFFNSLVQYQFRKMYVTGGFSRLTQGFSASTLPPQTISAYYIGISRWFNFF